MKKPGQPESAVEITAGRRSLLSALRVGVADEEQMAMAANWLRDLIHHHGLSMDLLTSHTIYKALETRTATDSQTQKAAANWIYGLCEVSTAVPPLANDRQVGGSHYQKAIQHWDFVGGHDYGYLTGQVTKYLFRWRDKNGKQDLDKAAHFLQKAVEMEMQHQDEGFIAPPLEEFLRSNKIPEDEAYVMAMVHAFHETRNLDFLVLAQARMARLVQQAA